MIFLHMTQWNSNLAWVQLNSSIWFCLKPPLQRQSWGSGAGWSKVASLMCLENLAGLVYAFLT